MKGKVSSIIQNGIATVIFFHPQSNSLPGEILRKLAEEIFLAGNNPKVKVIILKSEGDKTFCAGASFDELIGIKNFEEGKKFFADFALMINAIRKVPKFVIARVQGKTVGGGVGLAAAADYTLAVQDASIRLSELALQIGPFMIGPAVERKIGNSAFAALTINPIEWKTANWAREKGLYADIFPSVTELDNAINSLAEKLTRSNMETMTQLKKMLWKGTENWDTILAEQAEISGRLVLSEFTHQYIKKFKATNERAYSKCNFL
ncbi:MAG: enoyl-CoA hydratase/isomerase family protein [Bacteroidota bacterium]